jgi:ECF transporter S component (folate family)
MEKNKMMIQKLTLGSMFASMGILLKFASFIIPLFGIPMLRLDLIPVPVVLAGVILGPFYGLAVGIITDVAGHFILPQGVFHPGFTLNLALVGFLSGYLMRLFKSKKLKISISTLNIIFISILSVGAILYVLLTNEISIRQNGETMVYEFSSLFKVLTVISVIILFNICLFPVLYLKNNPIIKDSKLMEIMLITTVLEIFIFIALTPIWIQSFTNVPYIFNVIPRIFRAMFFIPLKAYLVFYIYKAYLQVSIRLQIGSTKPKTL